MTSWSMTPPTTLFWKSRRQVGRGTYMGLHASIHQTQLIPVHLVQFTSQYNMEGVRFAWLILVALKADSSVK